WGRRREGIVLDVVYRPHIGRWGRRDRRRRGDPRVADRAERHWLAEDVHAHALREDVRLEDAVDEERRVDAGDARHRRRTRQEVHGVAEGGGRLLHRERQRNRPDDLLDHGHVAEGAPEALLRCTRRRRLTETERDSPHTILRVSVHVTTL